jgi:hypothetical protein
MTRIKLLTGLAGAIRTYNPGDVVDWDDEDAQRLVAAGYAEFDGDRGAETGGDPAPKRGRGGKTAKKGA